MNTNNVQPYTYAHIHMYVSVPGFYEDGEKKNCVDSCSIAALAMDSVCVFFLVIIKTFIYKFKFMYYQIKDLNLPYGTFCFCYSCSCCPRRCCCCYCSALFSPLLRFYFLSCFQIVNIFFPSTVSSFLFLLVFIVEQSSFVFVFGFSCRQMNASERNERA